MSNPQSQINILDTPEIIRLFPNYRSVVFCDISPDIEMVERELGEVCASPHSETQVRSIVAGHLRTLDHRRKYHEVVFVAELLGYELRKWPQLFWLYLKALSRLSLKDEIARATEYGEDDDVPANMAAMAIRSRTINGIFAKSSSYTALWGDPATDIQVALASLPDDSMAYSPNPKLVHALLQIRGETTTNYDDFKKRLYRGGIARVYVDYLRRYARTFRHAQKSDLGKKTRQFDASFFENSDEVQKLAEQIRILAAPPNLDGALEEKRKGRGILITDVHAGPNCAGWRLDQLLGLPDTLLVNAPAAPARNSANLSFSTDTNGQLDFLRAVKAVKREPRLIRIFPDGPNGERVSRVICGIPIQIGVGAASLAWHGKASVYHLRQDWRDGAIFSSLIQGPRPADFLDAGEFKCKFIDFYASELQRLILGEPENIGGLGGIWPKIASHHHNLKLD